MIIDCISDLHGFKPKLEGGDLLLLAGDYTARNSLKEWAEFFAWLKEQNYRKKILIAGNHDGLLESAFPHSHKEAEELSEIQELLTEIAEIEFPEFEYLCDSGTEFEGLKIWGSPWTKTFEGMNKHCMSFTKRTEDELADQYEKIPHDVDILITHSPAYGILDQVKIKFYNAMPDREIHVGSKYLKNWLKYCGRPRIHLFGHIHESYGIKQVFAIYDYERKKSMVQSINASIMTEYYKPENKPIRIEL